MSTEELPLYDHRRLGREMNLFHVQEDAAGSVFWHPKGWTLFRVIEQYIRDRLSADGYEEVRTPQLIDKDLWVRSGHWDKFQKNMYTVADLSPSDDPQQILTQSVAETRHFAIKPMNCPGHVQIFNCQSVSYRQLPLRMAEFGCCHRSEPSGALHGIMRVRQFTQDDAHIFCTEDQVVVETKKFCDLLRRVYADFGFSEIKIGFSTRPEKRAGSDETWDRAEAALSEAVTAAGLQYEVYPGEGAFYGPKLEFALCDLRGREWQCGTLQLDFVLPGNLGALYTDQDGVRKHPVMLHRAILGSIERFIGILLEHYEGDLPYWLRPVQFAVLPVRPEQAEYAMKIARMLSALGLRGAADLRDENMNQKIKSHSEAKVPFILVVGGREAAASQVSVREIGSTKSLVQDAADACSRMVELCRSPGKDLDF